MSLFQTVKSISTAELKEKLNGSIQLLDVRTPAEYRGGISDKRKIFHFNVF